MGNQRLFQKYCWITIFFLSLTGCKQQSIRGVADTTNGCITSSSPFGGGSGTVADPYQICSKSQLDQVRNYLSSNFVQKTDLNIAGDCASFSPIGSSTVFSGTYDGQGFQIQNFCYHDVASVTPIGLFSQASGTVTNVVMTGVDIIGNNKVGALVGYTDGAVIQNSSSSGVVKGVNYVGGLTGDFENSISIGSSSSAQVVGSSLVGGLSGYSYSSYLQKSFASGAVSNSSDRLGGLVGEVNQSIADSCFATGSVTSAPGSPQTGGLFGKMLVSHLYRSYSSSVVNGAADSGGLVGDMAESTIFNSYATGSVTANNSGAGGFVGHIQSVNNKIFDCFSTGSVTALDLAGGFVGFLDNNTTGIISNVFTTTASFTGTDPATNHAMVGVDYTNPGDFPFTSGYYNVALAGAPGADVISNGDMTTALTAAQFTDITNFIGYDTTTIWKPVVTGTHPILQWMP